MSKTITIPDFLWLEIKHLSKQRYVTDNQPMIDFDDPKIIEAHDVGENDGKISLAVDIMRLLE